MELTIVLANIILLVYKTDTCNFLDDHAIVVDWILILLAQRYSLLAHKFTT